MFGNQHAHPTTKVKASQDLKNIGARRWTLPFVVIRVDLEAPVMHCKNITEIDASASAILYEMVSDYDQRGVFVSFVKIRPELFEVFTQARIIRGSDDLRVFNA